MVENNMPAPRKEMPAPMYQNRGVRLVSTISEILSVTVAKVSPGPITAAGEIVASESISAGSFDIRLASLLYFGIRILHRAEIGSSRSGVELSQQLVVALLFLELRHAAFGIVRIAEDDGLRRASLGAGGGDFAVAHCAVLSFGIDLRPLNALHTVGAFLHDAAAAHSDFRVAHHLERFGVEILVEQEIKAPHFVGAVVRAI